MQAPAGHKDTDHSIPSCLQWTGGEVQQNLAADDPVLCGPEPKELGRASATSHLHLLRLTARSHWVHT